EDAMPVISAIKNPIQKRESFDQAMNFFRIEDSGLKRDLWLTIKNGQRAEPAVVQKQVRRATQAKVTVAEQHLLELILHDDELREKVLPLLEETDYEMLATAPVYNAVYVLKDRKPTVESLLALTGEDEFFHDLVPLLMMAEPKRAAGDVLDEVFHDAENCIFTLRSMAIQNRLHDVSRELIEAEQAGDQARISHLVTEHLDLSKMHHALLNKISQT
ncbi:MAG TPA: hypothetical protein VJ781_09030, partial [Pyrinomonadaceae bacterium]|nr:hypothetical protein [Pyrinomonadaceae bacterium]